MSPIFVRPVREQLEHDRLIRHLHVRYKRKFDVEANLGDEQLAPVKIGTVTCFPDLVLTSAKKLAGVVEVESGESVNNLEAMAQWVRFSQARVPFHLYVPVHAYDAARRLCDAHSVRVAEVWTYRTASDEFDLVRMFQDPAIAARAPKIAPVPAVVPKKLAKAPAAKRAARPVKTKAAPARPKPAAKAKPAPRPAAKSARPAAARRPMPAVKKAAGRRSAAPPARPVTKLKNKKR